MGDDPPAGPPFDDPPAGPPFDDPPAGPQLVVAFVRNGALVTLPLRF